jgi:phytoene dehydrogenase-like protein
MAESANGTDVLVIGAGLAGSLAAAALARRGKRVTVLERERRVGGRLRSYDVGGYVVDAGAFLWPNRHLDAALDAAGAAGFRASAVPPGQLMRLYVQGCGGTRFAFPWPGRPETPRLLAAAAAALRADAATFRRLAELHDRIRSLPEEEIDRLRHEPAAAALGRFTADPALRDAFLRNVMLFGTYDPGAAAMGDVAGMLRRDASGAPPPRAECAGANTPAGVRALPLALERAMRAAGVEIRLGWEVEQIEVAGGRATGVWARAAAPFRRRLAAAAVVCNVPICDLFRLLPRELLPAPFVAAAERFRAVGGTVNSAFAFRAPPVLRETGEEDRFPGWTRLLAGSERSFAGGMLWTTVHSPPSAPPGRHLLQAMRLSAHAEIADQRRVAAITASFRTMLDEIYRDAADKLLWQKSWITRAGSEYLICSAPRPPVAAPGIDGLYFVGETTDVPAVQMDAAALSALRCVESLCG